MNEIIVKLQFLIPSLPRAEKNIAEYMLEHINEIHDMTLSMLSEESGASEATIIRFCKRMGYHSFVHLKQDFARSASYESVNLPDAVMPDNSMLTIFEKVSDIIQQSLVNTRTLLSNCDSDRALQAILQAKSVHFFAIGDATSTCQWACFKFNRIGIPSFYYNDVVFQYEAAMRMGKEDVVIAMSASGRSQNVVRAVKLAHEAGATTISITQTARSPLLKYTDISLITAGIDMTIGRDSVSKRIAEFAIIESFYLGAISRGPQDYDFLLQNTITSSDMNK